MNIFRLSGRHKSILRLEIRCDFQAGKRFAEHSQTSGRIQAYDHLLTCT